MATRKQKNKVLPPRMHHKHGAYYHVSTGSPRKWTKLHQDLGSSLKAWANLESSAIPKEHTTFNAIAVMYQSHEVSKLRDTTQKDYSKHLSRLKLVFGDMNLEHIKPSDIHQYVALRGQKSHVQANREKSVLSAMFNFARRMGLVDCPNPCSGIRGHKEKPREQYVTNAQFLEVYEVAEWWIQDAMDLAVYSGQRPADVLKIRIQDIQPDCLYVQQNKTGAKLLIAREGIFAEVLNRVLSRDRNGSQLLVHKDGITLTSDALRSGFARARKIAKATWQFRDLRAKAATDLQNLAEAQKLLGHRSRNTTEVYTRDRKGDFVKPLPAFSIPLKAA
jgi:integrase